MPECKARPACSKRSVEPTANFYSVLLNNLPLKVALAYESRKALPTFFDIQEPNGKGLLPEDAGGGGGARVQ